MHDPKLCSGFSLCGVCRWKKTFVLGIGTFSSNGIFLSIEHCIALNFSQTIENRLHLFYCSWENLSLVFRTSCEFHWLLLPYIAQKGLKLSDIFGTSMFFVGGQFQEESGLLFSYFHSFDRPQRCMVWGTWHGGLSFNCRYFHKSFVVQEKASAQFILLI